MYRYRQMGLSKEARFVLCIFFLQDLVQTPQVVYIRPLKPSPLVDRQIHREPD